jgi:hypothetical protein
MNRIKKDRKISTSTPYIPVRFRQPRGCLSFLTKECTRKVRQLVGLLTKMVVIIEKALGSNRRRGSFIKRTRPNRSSQRPFFLRSVKYKYSSMYLCSLLARKSSYSPDVWGCSKQNTVDAFDASLAGRKSNMSFDTDSFAIKIDNCCTRSMSFCKRDFLVGSMKPVRNLTVKGYGGSSTSITHQGTISWTIQDDNGLTNTADTKLVLRSIIHDTTTFATTYGTTNE